MAVLAAKAGWGLTGQAIALVSATGLVLPILIGDGNRAFPGWLHAQPDPATARAIWNLNWPLLANELSGRLGALSDNLIVAGILGSGSVSPFFS